MVQILQKINMRDEFFQIQEHLIEVRLHVLDR
jgi:hypothetical protein